MSEAEGFFGRWSRRKAQSREGLSPKDAPTTEVAPVASGPVASGPVTPSQPNASAAAVPAGRSPSAPDATAVPTLDEARDLTPQSDFRPFVGREVPNDVRNTALRRLFSDPHFNAMDGLDIYIDDYSQPDPLPAGMLRQLTSAQAMRLLDPPDEADTAPAGETDRPSVSHDGGGPPGVAQSRPSEPLDAHVPPNPDLRLQPDDAAGCDGPGPRA